MNKFHNSKIYKLTDNTNNNVYIGSTIQTIKQRLQGHKSGAKTSKEGYGCASKSIIDNGDYKIELLEEFSCENKRELLIKEQEYIDQYDCINKVNSHADPKKRYLLNREKILIKKRIYDKNYIKCECGGGYCMSHRARHLKSRRCQEYFKNKSDNKISLLYSIMSDPMSIVNLIKKFCKERNIPISTDELEALEEKHSEQVKDKEQVNTDDDDDNYSTESGSSESDSGSDGCVQETLTIAKTSDGFYKIIG